LHLRDLPLQPDRADQAGQIVAAIQSYF